jgi:CheY-like chemotaxis protein/transcriptional regulator with XRE-family HTH domain
MMTDGAAERGSARSRRVAAERMKKATATQVPQAAAVGEPVRAQRKAPATASARRTARGRLAAEPLPEALRARLAHLEAERRALRCSLADLARLLGMPQAVLSRLLKGQTGGTQALPAATVPEVLQRLELALRLFAEARQHAPRAAAQPAAGGRSGRAPRLAASAGAGQAARLAPSAATLPAYARVPLFGPEPAREPASTPAVVVTATRASYRVLIAEDDADTIALYRMVFADEDGETGYSIEVARTSSECIAQLQAAQEGAPFDLLLMDLGIAEIRAESGTGLLTRLRRTASLLPPRVLIVSGAAPHHLQARHADLAALHAAFLPKPFDIEELLAGVRSLCGPGATPAPGLQFFATGKARHLH